MADALVMDRMFQRIMRGLVDTGRAPHYAKLTRALGLGGEEGRLLLRDVIRVYPIGWLDPETDYIASFPPLNNLPTQYRVTVRGEQRWFAQCGFEATSVTWLFPGEPVRVDAPCLDCGDPVTIEMRDGRIVWVDPPESWAAQLRLRSLPRPVAVPPNQHEPLPVRRARPSLAGLPGARG